MAAEGAAPGRKAWIVTLQDDTTEIEGLVQAAGLELAGIVRQNRTRPDPAFHVGKGKVEELRAMLDPHPPASGGRPLLVVDADLRPTVVFNLEGAAKAEVWDRIRVILEIFERNARVKEARLQVELARLRYNLPFVHEAIHRERTGERAGYMGAGEMEARTYETHLKRRTRAITDELERVKKERRNRRTGRQRGGMRLLAIAGYTNGGKSSLLNAITGSEVLAQDRMFSTLQTTTKRLYSTYHTNRSSDILLTDTVGFIRDLPPWLVDAFRSTLEEITDADGVLLVVDASEAPGRVREKVTTALDILERIHAPRRRVLLLNKADLLASQARHVLRESLVGIIHPDLPIFFTSTLTGEGLQPLVEHVQTELLDVREAEVQLDLQRPEHVVLENWVRAHADILQVKEAGVGRILHIRCGVRTWGRLLQRATEAQAHVRPPGVEGKGGPPRRAVPPDPRDM